MNTGVECVGRGWTYCVEGCAVVFGVGVGSVGGGVGSVGLNELTLVLG